MPVASPKPEFDNAAWVTIPTQLDANTLHQFCLNPEKLFRLNPYLKIFYWRAIGNDVDVHWQNHSNGEMREVKTRLLIEIKEQELCVHYQAGIKQASYFIIEPNNKVADLIIVDRYASDVADENPQVDKSIHVWGEALNRFFKHYKYLRRLPLMEKVIGHFWIKLSPMARRITYILFVITLVEMVALMLLVLAMLMK